MTLAILLLLAGLTISAVAIYYSVLGLAAIFAATVPIYIMGGALELSKLIAASWLKANWKRATGFIKWYMLSAVSILMIITSMGIFGFLSKAHSDQGLVSSGNQIQIAEIDRQIEIEKRSIDDATRVISQLDQAVQSLTDSQSIRGRDGAVAIRRQQANERRALNNTIKDSNIKISELEQQKLPLVQTRLNIEAEVGPIKYLAQLIYGDNPGKDVLEKSVTWVIILLVIVFDPLAVVMLLAAQTTFAWDRQDKELSRENKNIEINKDKTNAISNSNIDVIPDNNQNTYNTSNEFTNPVTNVVPVELQKEIEELGNSATSLEPEGVIIDNTQKVTLEFDITKHPYLFQPGFGFKDTAPLVFTPENTEKENKVVESSSYHQESNVDDNEPEPTLVHTSNTSTTSVTTDNTSIKVDEPLFQIFPELTEESSKKKIYDQANGSADSKDDEVVYKQNSEQSESSIWNRIRNRVSDEFKPKDYLIVVYAQTSFDDFQYDAEAEPELDKFIKDIKSGKHSFGDYPQDQLKHFASRIYDLRKN